MIAQETFEMKGVNGEPVLFSSPYLNDRKQLIFKDCTKFTHHVGMEFVLNEKEKALEIHYPHAKTILVRLQGQNEAFLNQILQVKNVLLTDLVRYSKDLISGVEQILVFETGKSEHPYYFMSHSEVLYGTYTCKYTAGLLFLLNDKLNKKGKSTFIDEETMQKDCSKQFNQKEKSSYLTKTIDQNVVHALTLDELANLL